MFGMMGKHDRIEERIKLSNAQKYREGFVAGKMVGVIGGIVIGILLAPKSGKETIKELGEEAQKIFESSNVALPKIELSKLSKFRKTKADKAENDEIVVPEVDTISEEIPKDATEETKNIDQDTLEGEAEDKVPEQDNINTGTVEVKEEITKEIQYGA